MERTLFTNRWYALRPSKYVKRKPSSVDFLGSNVAIWRNLENQVIVQNNTCPHRGAKLSMGKTKNNCIECPYHGWKFDSEGNLVDLPADKNSSLINNTSIDTYHTIESGGFVWVCIGTPDGYNPPVLKEMHSKEWISVTGQEIFDADWLTTLENSIDITHVNFVHSDFGDSQNGHVDVDEIKDKFQDHLVMKSTIRHKSESLLLKFTENPNAKIRHDLLFPNTVAIRFWIQNLMEVITYVTYTPLNDNKTLVNWSFLRKPRILFLDGLLNKSFDEGMKKAILEDKEIVESLSQIENRLNIAPDKIQILFRKRLEKLQLLEPTHLYE
uniref:Rieske domain-containing protein n=1 Tax=viral metagenome TaxID=1070528 RepID=A0A6C0F932_9ZZZZ|tara:strand:- start:5213 stop:6190 length:978 start_codon:yes stop_codon:yes gene_type:complete